MELIFEHTAELGAGANPAAVHLADNSVYLFSVSGGRLKARHWIPGAGDVPWGSPAFGPAFTGTADKNMSLVRLKNVPRMGIYGAWRQAEVYKDGALLVPERQRFAIWAGMADFSKYLDSCTIEMSQGTPIRAVSMTLDNPKQFVAGEAAARIVPGMKIELLLTLGDSEEYPLGVYYADHVNMGVTKSAVSIEGRSISGKLLKDQVLDENFEFPRQTYFLNVVKLLKDAGIEGYDVQSTADPNAWEYGIRFMPSMGTFDALSEMIRASRNWAVIETMDGKIVAGSVVSYPPIQVTGTYTFERGKDIWSRDVVRDDKEIYHRVCGWFLTATGATYLYAPVVSEYEWIAAPHKTLHIQFPDDSDDTEVRAIVSDIAGRIANAGIVETFVGPLRPQLLVGDEARITSDDGTQILGTVTTVRHMLGKDGFMTEFTVDSGGEKGRLNIRELINSAVQPARGTGKRVFA